VVITGINVGDYDGGDGSKTLSDLLQAVDKVEGIERIRLSSIDPDEVDEKLLETIIYGKHTCHSMHIVLQSGSNFILKRMNRKYTRQIFLESVLKLREASKDFTFTTDIIVGFPGESERDFDETLEVVKAVKFAKVHTFPYSPRERTRAFMYEDKVEKAIIKERKSRLILAAEEAAYLLREEYVGRKMQILTESSNEAGSFGHTSNFLEVMVPDAKQDANQLLEVNIVANTRKGLVGTLA
jgi:threonylcarbamoyladenosine tRNA methylthiotransferase MtaB